MYYSGKARDYGSEELAKLLVRQAGVPHDVAHGDRVDRVVPRDGDDPGAVGRYNVLALPGHPEAGFLQGPHGVKVVDSGQPGHV
jgi:hypothetical protein